jgi:hypothetical protein
MPSEGKWLVSTEGGTQPIWSPNGRELFFQKDRQLYVVTWSVRNGVFTPSSPRLWSDKLLFSFQEMNLAIHPDGKRFAYSGGFATAEGDALRELVFLFHFTDELRRRLPL